MILISLQSNEFSKENIIQLSDNACFTENELKSLLYGLSGLSLLSGKVDGSNWITS